jgi:hypothetical protein
LCVEVHRRRAMRRHEQIKVDLLTVWFAQDKSHSDDRGRRFHQCSPPGVVRFHPSRQSCHLLRAQRSDWNTGAIDRCSRNVGHCDNAVTTSETKYQRNDEGNSHHDLHDNLSLALGTSSQRRSWIDIQRMGLVFRYQSFFRAPTYRSFIWHFIWFAVPT